MKTLNLLQNSTNRKCGLMIKISVNSLFQLEGYSLLHESRKYRRVGGVAIFVHELFCYTKRNDLCINCEAIESLSIEIRNNNGKNIIFNIVYRPPDGDLEVCENYFQSILSHN